MLLKKLSLMLVILLSLNFVMAGCIVSKDLPNGMKLNSEDFEVRDNNTFYFYNITFNYVVKNNINRIINKTEVLTFSTCEKDIILNELTGLKTDELVRLTRAEKQKIKQEEYETKQKEVLDYTEILHEGNETIHRLNTSIMVNNIYTESLTINSSKDYLKDFTDDKLSSKTIHKDSMFKNGIRVINLEPRIVGLEGAIRDIKILIESIFTRLNSLETENQLLKDELCARDNTYSFCRAGVIK